MPNGTYGGVRGKETRVGQKTFVSRPTRLWGGEEGVFVWHHNVALRSRECVVGKKIFTIFAPYCCLIDYERFRSLASLLCACRLMLLEAVSLAGRVRR